MRLRTKRRTDRQNGYHENIHIHINHKKKKGKTQRERRKKKSRFYWLMLEKPLNLQMHRVQNKILETAAIEHLILDSALSGLF